MAIENTVSNDFWSLLVDSINVFDCPVSGVFPIGYNCMLYYAMSTMIPEKELSSTNDFPHYIRLACSFLGDS